jgi:Rps23 Pro-64 3,4-dihydroxylase Tpa1-like proline 4-hydroxylase
MVNIENLVEAFGKFHGAMPFDHCVVDGFLNDKIAKQIAEEFLPYGDKRWYQYDNALELKKTLNDWSIFPPNTYSLLNYLNSSEFVSMLSDLVGTRLFSDSGLHGGGWHIHGEAGNLNPHLDYSLHPKLNLQRKVNIIIYLSTGLTESDGGHLGLWGKSECDGACGDLRKEISIMFNRAVIFDTTQHSWHGMSRKFLGVNGKFRKSLAVYYLCKPSEEIDRRARALFAPRPEQKGDESVEALIRIRSDNQLAHLAYRTNDAKK